MDGPKPAEGTAVESDIDDAARKAGALDVKAAARLAKHLGSPVPSAELEIWAAMPPPQRAKAMQRMGALEKHRKKELTAKLAAADAGVELGRFYQMARAWKASRSLKSLGAYSSVTKQRQAQDPEVAKALQAAVVMVVKPDDTASVDSLARRLAEMSGLPEKKLPKRSTLRMYIERERRRLRTLRLAGTEIQFDCASSSLRRIDGAPHFIFFVLDEGTGLILGHGVGMASDTMRGYAAASEDALRRIPAGLPPRKMWASRCERSEIVPGDDAERVLRRLSEIKGELRGVTPQMTNSGDFGRYLKGHMGKKLGPIRLGVKGTLVGGDVVGTPLTDVDAHARVELAVKAYNDDVGSRAPDDGEGGPPGELVRLLEMLAAG